MNPSNNVVCSNCATRLDLAKREETPNYTYMKPKKSELEKMIEGIRTQREPPKNIYEILKPTETKLFLFINMVFASIFLIFLINQKILFVLLFYPALYGLSCRWVTKPKFDWQSFLMEFGILLVGFYILFIFLPF
jgi:hypothetical protein